LHAGLRRGELKALKIAETVRSHLRALGSAAPRAAPRASLNLTHHVSAEEAPAGEPRIERPPMQAPAMQSAPAAANDLATENLAQQMLTLVEIAATQDRQIQALKARCERLERREQAGMVAFTAFFHILDANDVSDLAAMAGVFGSLIDQAQQLDLPEDSILYLRRIESMLRDQHADDRDIVQ
jgi:hypothetical protein